MTVLMKGKTDLLKKKQLYNLIINQMNL